MREGYLTVDLIAYVLWIYLICGIVVYDGTVINYYYHLFEIVQNDKLYLINENHSNIQFIIDEII